MKLLPLGRFLPQPKSKQIDVWKSCMQYVCVLLVQLVLVKSRNEVVDEGVSKV